MLFSTETKYGCESKQTEKQHSASEPLHKARCQFTIHVAQYLQNRFRKYETFDRRYLSHDNTSRILRHGVQVLN